MDCWYKPYTKGPKGNRFLANCANTGVDVLYEIAEKCPEGYMSLEEITKPKKSPAKKKAPAKKEAE